MCRHTFVSIVRSRPKYFSLKNHHDTTGFGFNNSFDIVPVLWLLAVIMLLFPSSKAFHILIAASHINSEHCPCSQLCHHNRPAVPLAVVIALMNYNQHFDLRAALQ